MKVSIIVAAYNIEKYIKRCLLSVVNQTYNNIEIIVVNDGSTDNTLEIVREFLEEDKRIKIINQDNKGLVEARKVGFNNSTGEYILFIDGDDWLELNSIEKLLKIVQQEWPDIVMYNGFYAYDDRSVKNDTFNNDYKLEIKRDPLKHLFLDNILPGIVYKFIRKEFLIENKINFPENISYAEDLAMVSNMFMHNPKVSLLNENLYNYYQRQGSVSKSTDKILEVEYALSFIQKQLHINEIYKNYEKEFEKLVYRHLLLSKILRIDEIYLDRKNVYNQYKKRKIKINKNHYIQSELRYGNINLRNRVRLYNISYLLGTFYDLLRNKINKVNLRGISNGRKD